MNNVESPPIEVSKTLTSTQKHIQERIHAFELGPLVCALLESGYSFDRIIFRTTHSRTSKNQICEAITFKESHAIVTLNIGILGPNALLPSYFLDAIRSDKKHVSMYLEFFDFFNHHLIKDLALVAALEKNPDLFPNWHEQMEDYLSMLGITSLSTFAHLSELIFPDFERSVQKNPKIVRLKRLAFTLGQEEAGGLGQQRVLGGQATRTFANFRLRLVTEHPLTQDGAPWPEEILKRVREQLMPHLKKSSIHLSLTLVITKKCGHIHLEKSSHLGFERMGPSDQPYELLLYYGLLGDGKGPKA